MAAPAICFALPTTLPSGPPATRSCSLTRVLLSRWSSQISLPFVYPQGEPAEPCAGSHWPPTESSVAEDRGYSFGLGQWLGELVADDRHLGAAGEGGAEQGLEVAVEGAVKDQVVDPAFAQRLPRLLDPERAADAALAPAERPLDHGAVALAVEPLDRVGDDAVQLARGGRDQVGVAAGDDLRLAGAEALLEALGVLGRAEDDHLGDAALLQGSAGELPALAEEALAVVFEPFTVLVVAGGADALGPRGVVGALRFALAPVEAEEAQFPVLELLEGAGGAAQQPHPLGGDDRDAAGAAAADEGDQRRDDRLRRVLGAIVGERRRSRPPPVLDILLLGDRNEA